MHTHKILSRYMTIACVAGIVFSITGRLAIRQITHDNMGAVKSIGGELYSNALPESRPEIYELEARLYKRVALSPVREKWERIYGITLWCGIIAGIVAIVSYLRKKN